MPEPNLNEKVKNLTESRVPKKPREKIKFDSFEIIKLLGNGAFGKVYLAKKKDTGKLYRGLK